MNTDENASFQVSVKGLFFDDTGNVLLLQEPDGLWEAPGGRIQEGESPEDALGRECLEETGINCEIIETHPFFAYIAPDSTGKNRFMVFYKIVLENLNFVKSEECVDMKFFSKEEMRILTLGPTMKLLPNYL